jgi:hypothetical protein
MAAPMVGENSIGIRLAWRSFQAAIKRSGIGRAPVRRFLLRDLAALILHLARLNPMTARYF